jgi:hypothetical protein
LFLLFLIPGFLQAQQSELTRNFHKNWRLGGGAGVSYLAFELKKNFSRATMDMNSTPNASFSFFSTKRFTKNFEVGLEYEKCYFSGFKVYSSNVNWLMYDERFNNEKAKFHPYPVYYHTDISSWYLNFHYNYLNFYTLRKNFLNVNLYLKAGIGFSLIGVELGYQDPSHYEITNLPNPLYVKGSGRHPMRDSYATWHMGLGFNYYISNRWSIYTEAILLFVSCDYLDGVHNYDVTKQADGSVDIKRIGVFDTVGQFRFGVSYHFNMPQFRRSFYSNKWTLKKNTYQNDFYYDKKHNKVIPPVNPYNRITQPKR